MTSIDQAPGHTVPVRAPYDRHEWERAVMASSLHYHAKHVALALAHYGGDAGYLPAGGPQETRSLSAATGLFAKHVRFSLSQLQGRGLISRPGITSWRAPDGAAREEARPVTLTMPPARTEPAQAGDGAERTEPAHPSPAAS